MQTQSSRLRFVHYPSKEIFLAIISGLILGLASLFSPWLGLAIASMGICFLLVLTRPILLCYVMIFAIAFFSGMNRGRIIPYFIPNEPLLALASGLAIPTILIARRASTSRISSFTAGWICLVFGTSIIPFLIYLIRRVSLTMSEVFALLAPLQYLLIYMIFRYIPTNEVQVRGILRWMLACTFFIGVIGLLQALRVGFILNLLASWYSSGHEEVALDVGRVSSVLGAWNSLGTFLMISLLILRAVIDLKPALMSKKAFLLVTAACAGCLIASGSYAGMIGLGLGLLIFEIFNTKGRKAIIAILFAGAVLAIPLQKNIFLRLAYQFQNGNWIPQTLAYRFKVWQEIFLPLIEKTWLWGYHPVMPSTLAWLYPESQYFELLLKSGIISLIGHLFWVVLSMIWSYRIIRSSSDLRRSLAACIFILFMVLSIMGLTNGVFTFSGVIEYLWILIALTGVLGDEDATSSR